MKTCYERLYFLRNNSRFVKDYLEHFLLFQIYSPLVLRMSYGKWPELPKYLRDNTPEEIVTLIDKSYTFSNAKLQAKLNKYLIEKAIYVLKNYQNCGVPLTQDSSVKQTRRKLTSDVGDKNLKKLEQAKKQDIFSDKMADLAIRCSHKFLFDSKNYRSWKITAKMANDLLQNHAKDVYIFPSIQLTKGCENHCSHCCDRAMPHISHMPWPVFVSLHRALNKYYRHYPQNSCDHYFSKFFADSDTLSYYDHIMGTDAGDVGLWISDENALCLYLTRGVRGERSKVALSKAIISQHGIGISFVDTVKENMIQNVNQLNETLDVVQSIPNRKYDPYILHIHMKSGPTVSDEIFRGFHTFKSTIWAIGRGKNLPENETEHYADCEFNTPHIIAPNGDILKCKIENGENIKHKDDSIYKVKGFGKQLSLYKRLVHFFRRQK